MQNPVQDAPAPQLAWPSTGQWLLFLGLLGWLGAAPIVVGIITATLPGTDGSLAVTLIPALMLAVILVLPSLLVFGLARWQNWLGFKPLALALLITALYISVAVTIRAVSSPASQLGSSQEILLRLILLTPVTFIIGGLGLLAADVPRHMLLHAFGFNRPPLVGILILLVLIAVVTIGWPLTGALGDSWTSQLIVLQALAISLTEEILFRGAVLGIITYNFQQRKPLAALLALLLYLAFIPSKLVPHNDWVSLLLPIALLPLALLTTELRALTGSIWAGIFFAAAYRAAPTLFTDPRVELPLLTQPLQTLAYLWLWLATAGLVGLLWAGRQFLTPRWQLSRTATIALAVGLVLVGWGLWAAMWRGVGYPGFYNDGFLIIMQEQADISQAETITDLTSRRAFVRDRLIDTARRSQAPVWSALDAAGLAYRPFYVINMIQVHGQHRRMAEFANLPGVARVMLNPNVRPYPLSQTSSLGYGLTDATGEGVGWNISQVQADEVWDLGVLGQGIVVAGQDTGYDWTHPALRDAYRGSSNDAVDHTYNWHDAWSNAPAPIDDDQHGTHTMGTILGDDHNGNQIGMAPGAQWIGCRNMRRGIGNPASYADCMEFFLAPYPPGSDPSTAGDVTKAPHLVNNSWGCPDIEGCDDSVLEPATAALRAAGIMMVVSAGNEGPLCQTVTEPPARYDDVFSVGATERGGQITGFSSRGPVLGAEALLKPDISAPGQSIRSSLPGGGYGTADGTSMAGPHVAGLVALMWSANPTLIGQIDQTEALIRQSARPVAVSTACPLNAPPTGEPSLLEQLAAMDNPTVCACGEAVGVPNNVYGWGEIDALQAVRLAQEWQP